MHLVYPPPPPGKKNCITIVFVFLGRLQYPGETGNNGYAKFWVLTRCSMVHVKMVNINFHVQRKVHVTTTEHI